MNASPLYLSQIRSVLTNIEIEDIEQAGGQFNDVVIINQAWVFRFPRFHEGVARLAAEARLLEALRKRLPLPIPDPVYQCFNPPVPGLVFLGYQKLPGNPFYRQSLGELRDEGVRDDLALQLAGFLRALHHISPVDIPVKAEIMDMREGWESTYADIREKLFPCMRVDARTEVTAHFEAYLDDRQLHQFIPCLRHGDFGGSNILWDAGQGMITGVIDFSFCALGDAAYDLASISTMGEDFYTRLVPSYEPDPARRSSLLARARFYRGTFALSEALDGLRDHDPESYRHGMEGYL